MQSTGILFEKKDVFPPCEPQSGQVEAIKSPTFDTEFLIASRVDDSKFMTYLPLLRGIQE
jgi:hypothetical protein